jgi:hypothetical protein
MIAEGPLMMQFRPMRIGRVRVYTDGLDELDAGLTGVEWVADLTAAVAESMARHRDPHVAFVPEGPYVVPVHEEA